MAHTTSSLQIPQHVNTLLAHLTSRPGVQSTFILSRRDGSIIQSTGLFPSLPEPSEASTPQRSQDAAPAVANTTISIGIGSDTVSDVSPANIPLPESPRASRTPYQPSYVETLAAHIFAFVCSAAELSSSLTSLPLSMNGSLLNGVSGEMERGIPMTYEGCEEAGVEKREKEEEDDVKLLRFRSRRNEVVVVPDKKYILCVVHDATGGNEAAGAGGTRGWR